MLAEDKPSSYVAWDLLALGDEDLRAVPQQQRRERLVAALAGAKPPVHITPATRDRALAADWFARFEGAGLDGVMAKPEGHGYQPGKRAMLKIKHQRTADCVVAGFRWYKGGKDTLVGSLLLGLYDAEGMLHHVGVAPSFKQTVRAELAEMLKPLRDRENHPWRDWADFQDTETAQRLPGATRRWNRGKDLSWEPLRLELVVRGLLRSPPGHAVPSRHALQALAARQGAARLPLRSARGDRRVRDRADLRRRARMIEGMRWLLLVVALGGCDLVFRIDHLDPSGIDAHGPFADGTVPPDTSCAGGTVAVGRYGTSSAGLVQVCVPATGGPLVLGGPFNTDLPAACQPMLQQSGPELCVVAATNIAVATPLVVTGLRPLVLAAAQQLTIDGSITVDGSATAAGPGGDAPNCASGPGGTDAAKGGGGGGGGSWGGVGGIGGIGGPAGTGGFGHAGGVVTAIRGGCRGGYGGDGSSANSGGLGGHAGGAIYLIAGASIIVRGNISASGGGGHFGAAGTTGGGGGGGGGAGGLVAFDTPMLTIAGATGIWANGGGGGGGGGAGTGVPVNGSDGGVSTGPAVHAAAGSGGTAGTTMGGTGGSGGVGSLQLDPGGTGSDGGGGGGGGAGGGGGFVILYSSQRGVAGDSATSPKLTYD